MTIEYSDHYVRKEEVLERVQLILSDWYVFKFANEVGVCESFYEYKFFIF
jgi:hypothetical protein